MKITIENPAPGEEEELIIRCRSLDERLMKLIYALKSGEEPLNGYQENRIVRLSPGDIFYFEAVEGKVFAYTADEVCEVRRKLYEIEDLYGEMDFLRISKSTIVNVSKIDSVKPVFNSRFEAKLKNGEIIVISRQYVAALKKKLGI